MRIKNLKIKNIGPFETGEMDFILDGQENEKPPVIIITGENGTGKSIVLDSIRGLFLGRIGVIERQITASTDFLIECSLMLNNEKIILKTNKQANGVFTTNNQDINQLFNHRLESKLKKNFALDYWTSRLSNDSFDIKNIVAVEPEQYLDNSLKGVHTNLDVTKIISFFDYLKDSSDEYEQKLGRNLYALLEKIINLSITEGKLSHVSRINLKPIIKIRNQEVTLDKLSSGNLYLIQRFVSLLRQVYSICSLNKISIEDYQSIEGVLLIDEAENHLHPKWQKVFLNNILTLFPNLQLIVTTHSPFIVSSVENSRIYVCKSEGGRSVVVDETDVYSNKPVEEILMSPLFNTSNFNNEIAGLIKDRKIALAKGDDENVERIEKVLLEKNPEYFNYLNVESLIKSLQK